MDKIKLPNGLEVSTVAIGTMNFGSIIAKEDAYAMLDAYAENGGNFLDTSNNYAHWAGVGNESELLLGQWMKERGCRDQMVVATKVGFDRHGIGAGLKKEQIEYWIDESLKNLQTDYVDLYYAHTDDPDTPLEETMDAFISLVKKGKVRHLGGSNYDTWRFAEANAIANAQGMDGYTVMQQKYTYLYPREDVKPKYKFNEIVTRERLRYLKQKEIPLVAYACLAKGGYEVPGKLPQDYISGDRLTFIQNMAKEKGVNTGALVIAWLINLWRCEEFPRVIPLFGSSKMEQFESNLVGTTLTLTDEELQMLNQA